MKLIDFQEIMDGFSEEDRVEIQTNAKKMIDDYKIQELYAQLAEYNNATKIQSESLFCNNELEFGIRQLKD